MKKIIISIVLIALGACSTAPATPISVEQVTSSFQKTTTIRKIAPGADGGTIRVPGGVAPMMIPRQVAIFNHADGPLSLYLSYSLPNPFLTVNAGEIHVIGGEIFSGQQYFSFCMRGNALGIGICKPINIPVSLIPSPPLFYVIDIMGATFGIHGPQVFERYRIAKIKIEPEKIGTITVRPRKKKNSEVPKADLKHLNVPDFAP